ncbi:MAG: Eco57I restriction-modification methylase domain-containing protein [Promethearchaeota archaeon]
MFYTSAVVSDRMLELIFKPKFDQWSRQISKHIASLPDLDTDINFTRDRGFYKNTALEKVHEIYIEIISMTVCDPAVGHGIFLIRTFSYLVELFSRLCDMFHALPRIENLEEILWYKNCMFQENTPERQVKWAEYVIRHVLYGIDIQEDSIKITRKKLLVSFSEWCKSLLWSVPSASVPSSPFSEKNEKREKICQHALETHIIVANSLLPGTWQLHFPAIFEARGGFSVILCNPPWKMHQMNDLDFFTHYDPCYLSSSPKQRQKIERNLLQSPAIQDAYKKKITDFKTTNEIYRQSYVLQGEQKFNLYKLFVERILTLLALHGVCGLVIPLGLLGEYRARPLRKKLFLSTQLSHIFHLFTNEAFFPTITAGQPFSVLIFTKGLPTRTFQYYPHITSEDEFLHPFRTIAFTQDQICQISPQIRLNRQKSPSYAIPLVDTQEELDLLIFLSHYPRLSFDWGLDVRRELNRTDDLRNGVMVTNPGPIPVLEGKHLTHYGYSTSRVLFFINPSMDYSSYRPYFQYSRIVWRNVSNIRLRRRMFCTLIPNGIATVNSLNYMVPFKKILVDGAIASVLIARDELLYLVGMLGSLVCEFQLRMFSTNNNLNQYLIENLAIPFYDPHNSLHQALVNEITDFLPQGRKWADEMVLLRSRHHDKQELERTYLPSLAKIDALCVRIFALNSDQVQVLRLKFPKIDDIYFQMIDFDKK